MTICIRKAAVSDLDQVYQFERAYMLEHEPTMVRRWDEGLDRTVRQLHQCLSSMYVAEGQGHVIGHAYWSIYEKSPCVFSLFVHQAHRGDGVGKKLMNELERSVMAAGYNHMTLSTLTNNAAQYLFDHMGYIKLDIADGWISYRKELKEIDKK